MSIPRLFASNILWRGSYLFTSLALTILMSRYLEAAVTGWLFHLLSILIFVFMFFSLGIESSITYFGSRKEMSDGKLQWFSLLWVVITSVLIFSGIHLSGNLFLSRGLHGWMALSFVGGNLLITFYSSFFYARGNYRLPNLVFIAANLLLILLLVVQKATGVKANDFIPLFFLSYILQGIVIVALYNMVYRSRFLFSFPTTAEIKRLFTYSTAAYAATLLFYLVTRIDYWFIDYFLKSKELLGNYIQASRLVQLFQMLPVILAASIFPISASGHSEAIREGIIRLSRVMILFYIICIAIVLLTGKWVFPIIFGPTFKHMYNVFLLLVPGLLSLSILSLFAAYFASVNRIRNNLMISLAGLFVIIVSDLLLIPPFGIDGAAVASSIGYTVCFIFGFYFFKKEHPLQIIDLLFFKKEDMGFLLSLVQKVKTKPTNTVE